jgi:transcriptional regulator with XRE-family HTH domain
MNKNVKNKSLLNNSEIARRLKVSPQYIGQVMRGDKPGKKITPKILALIERTLKNSLRAA